MNIGDLRHRVEIISATEKTLSGNQKRRDWASPTVVATVWAEIMQLSGNAAVAAKQQYPEAQYQVRMRYLPTLSDAHRIRYGTRIFRILGPPNNVFLKNAEHICLTVEV